MGHTKKILGFSTVQPISTFYSDLFAIELAENFHIHLRNLRVELDHNEFLSLCEGFRKAYLVWQENGKLTQKRYAELEDKFLNLYLSKVSPIPCLWNTNASNDEIRIELQHWADYIHLHYKQIKFEFSVREFLEFAEVVENARSRLQKEIEVEENPCRWGKFHRANPDHRVRSPLKKNSFWTCPEDMPPTDRPYASNYYNQEDAVLKNTRLRHVDDPKHLVLDSRDLFDITLYHSGRLSPWAVDSNGINRMLAARYDFVELFMRNGRSLSSLQIQSAEYWKLLHKSISDVPRDGGTDWVYADPADQCERFIQLINSIVSEGYLGDRYSSIFRQFDGSNLTKIIKNGVISNITNNDGGYPGMMSVVPCKGGYRVWNGLHRIAILKYLLEHNCLPNNRVVVRKVDDTTFSPRDFVSLSSVSLDSKMVKIKRLVPLKLKKFIRRFL